MRRDRPAPGQSSHGRLGGAAQVEHFGLLRRRALQEGAEGGHRRRARLEGAKALRPAQAKREWLGDSIELGGEQPEHLLEELHIGAGLGRLALEANAIAILAVAIVHRVQRQHELELLAALLVVDDSHRRRLGIADRVDDGQHARPLRVLALQKAAVSPDHLVDRVARQLGGQRGGVGDWQAWKLHVDEQGGHGELVEQLAHGPLPHQ
eukprot:scaffold291955_cov32-Tisochrysis_lutea.AAC.4